jgi:hypothetical protein
VNTLLNALSMGFRQTFIYEMIDEYWQGYVGMYFSSLYLCIFNNWCLGQESHFGLFRQDQSPKPAARALHFLSGLLSDAGGNTGSIDISFSSIPISAKYLLFQKSDNTFVLVLWNNAPVYDDATQSDITPTPQQVRFLPIYKIQINNKQQNNKKKKKKQKEKKEKEKI